MSCRALNFLTEGREKGWRLAEPVSSLVVGRIDPRIAL
ncbi:MAG: hypothetical protein JWP34_4840 [Massilia sp.]|nr:hypothetical protein [Massilia sp.]